MLRRYAGPVVASSGFRRARAGTLPRVTYTAAEGRQQILDELASATDRLAVALACVGAAYDLLDEQSGDRLEEALFRPVQHALGTAQRTYTGFASRHGMAARTFETPNAGHASQGAKAFIERAMDQAAEAAHEIAELQDTMLPVEVGDAELRAGLAEVRDRVEGLRADARDFTRTLGR